MEILKHEQFEAQKELTKISMEVSSARATLGTIKKDIEEWETKKDLKIKEILGQFLSGSKEMVDSIEANYAEIHKVYLELKNSSDFLKELQQNLKEMLTNLHTDSVKFVENVKKEETKLAEMRKDTENELKILEIEQATIKKGQQELLKQKEAITLEQKSLKETNQALEKLWNKLKN